MYIVFAFIGMFFLLSDINKKAFYKLVLGAAFLFTSIVAFKFPQRVDLQIFSLVVFLAAMFLLIRLILKKEKSDTDKKLNLSDYIGKTATVKKDIGKTLSIDGIGLIEFNNQIWQAKSITDSEILADTRVEIVSRENMIMNVKVAK